MRYNVNNYVRVKLTPHGTKILRAKYKDLFGSTDEQAAAYVNSLHHVECDGYTAFQLWDLMQLFGEYMGNGVELPFEIEIILDDSN